MKEPLRAPYFNYYSKMHLVFLWQLEKAWSYYVF